MAEKKRLAYCDMGLLDSQKRFSDERRCGEYLVGIRFPYGFVCPHCGSAAAGRVWTRALWQCRECRRQVSVTAGTMFQRTRTPLREWFWAVILTAKDKRGHSVLQLSKELGIPYHRAWPMMHKIRAAMAHRDACYRLDDIVEMDEAYFGAPDPGKRGRSTGRAKALVAVGLTTDSRPRFAKLKVVRRLDARSVAAFATAGIATGSTIRTDGLNVYNCLATHGFTHEPTVAPGRTKEDVLHWAHIVISNAKVFIVGTFHGLGDRHIQQYLNEFCYRFNRRHRENELFDRILRACATAPQITHDELTA
jgi:transposase-like protein